MAATSRSSPAGEDRRTPVEEARASVDQARSILDEREVIALLTWTDKSEKDNEWQFSGDSPTDDGVNRASLGSLRACFYICIRASVQSRSFARA